MDHDAQGDVVSDISELARAVLGFQITIDPSLPGYEAFDRAYHDSPTNFGFAGIDMAAPMGEENGLVNQYVIFTYDAMWLLARALHTCIYDLGCDPRQASNRTVLYEVLTSTTLPQGASGFVQLDSLGDRLGGFSLWNFRDPAPGEAIDPGAKGKWHLLGQVNEVSGALHFQPNVSSIQWQG